jgi:hypothetical protein
VKPEILVDIICANKWHKDKKCMVHDDQQKGFSLVKGNGYHFMYPETDKGL